MEQKTNDLMLNLVANPNFTLGDFAIVGLNANNTSLQDKSFYKDNPIIQKSCVDKEGNFDENLFDQYYNSAMQSYNIMASDQYAKEIDKQISYHRDDIFAPQDQKQQGPLFQQILVSNPDRISQSMSKLGAVGERKKSRDELAQAEKVLLNPNEVYANGEPDWSKAKWGKDAHNGFFDYFFDTLVMAQWDEDGEHIDPVTGEKVQHNKGELKLNENGTYYYEKLDGRDIYGRQVLNKMNVLTEDGSTWNKYDFFDSDDIEQKSVGGTIMKNLALVGTMFLPYVGPWVAGASIATQLVGLMGTLGKMYSGSENQVFSAMEGWSKSLNRQTAKTEYAQENTWCWENFIGLIGDVAGQLKEQRFMFEKVPAVFKGKYAGSQKAQNKLLTERKSYYDEIAASKLSTLKKSKNPNFNALKTELELNANSQFYAQQDLDSWMKGYNKIGEIFSKGYMTAITVGDTYGEAKEAGASDIEATLLTMGYAAGEYAILNTGIGEWILPELRADRYKNKAIVRTLAKLKTEPPVQNGSELSWKNWRKMTSDQRKTYAKKLFDEGKKIATAEYANGTRTLKATLAAGLGEGVEEVSEEVLADFSKAAFNTVQWLQGDDTRMTSFGFSWNRNGEREFNAKDIWDRYGMSFVGGLAGGALTNLGTNYRMGKSYNNMTSQQALQEVMYMARNNQLESLYKTLDKETLLSKTLSFDVNEDGSFKPADENNSQDAILKKAIRKQIDLVQDFLIAEGANKSDDSLLDINTLGDLRFGALHNAVTAGLFLQDFNETLSELFNDIKTLETTKAAIIDTNQDGVVQDKEISQARRTEPNPTQKAAIQQLEEEIAKKRQKIKDFLEGKKSLDYVKTTLYEMTSILSGGSLPTSFSLWVKYKTGKNIDELQESKIQELHKSYKEWKNGEGKNQIYDAAQMHFDLAVKSSEVIKKRGELYKQQSQRMKEFESVVNDIYNIYQKNISKNIDAIQEITQSFGQEQKEGFWIASLFTGSKYFVENAKFKQYQQELANELKQIQQIQDPEQQDRSFKIAEAKFQKNITKLFLDNVENLINPIIENGWASNETKFRVKQLVEFGDTILSELQTKLAQKLDQIEDPDDYDATEKQYNDISKQVENIQQLSEKVDNLKNTPLEESLKEYSVAIGAEFVSPTDLMNKVQELIKTVKRAEEFDLDGSTLEQLDDTINLMMSYQQAIMGAKTDNAGFGDLYGFNATLNEIAKKTKQDLDLAEIDSKYANLVAADLDLDIKKLQFLRQLYNANRGMRISRQKRLGVKREALIYRGFRNIIQIPDNDPEKNKLVKWEGFQDLKTKLESLDLLKEYSEEGRTSFSLNPDQVVTFEQQKIAMKDAIYEFFQANMDKIENPDELSYLISKFDVYTNSEEIFNENVKEIDGPSLIWELAANAALKATNFYSVYRQTLNPANGIIPVPSQESMIYQNYAFIMNGNIFTAFHKAYRKHIVDNWNSLQELDRKTILRNLGKDEDTINKFSTNEMAKFCISFLPVPRFQNISLIEGIPGSGKSSAVLTTIIRMLDLTAPDLLKNIAWVHGANKSSAAKLAKNCGKENQGKMYGRDFLDFIIKKYTHPDYANGITNIDQNDYGFSDENEIKSNYETSNNTDDVPSIIIIDEISKFNVFELDAIDDYAKKHGITVITAGDYDQSGVKGSIKVKYDQNSTEEDEGQLEAERNMFIRNMKLGVSMRTDNTAQSQNIMEFQQWKNSKEPRDFKVYYSESDELGLQGTKVLGEGDLNLVEQEIEKLIPHLRKPDPNATLKELKEGEKIGYIVSDINSPAYKAIKANQKLSQYVEFYEDGSAQGLEGRYYIIDTYNTHVDTNKLSDENTKTWFKDTYTGISRASVGAILLVPSGANISSEISNDIEQEQLFTEELIAKQTEERKRLYDTIITDAKVPEYQERTKELIEDDQQVPDPIKKAKGNSSTPTVKYQGTDQSIKINDFVVYSGKTYSISHINDDGESIIIKDKKGTYNVKINSISFLQTYDSDGKKLEFGSTVTYKDSKYHISDIIDENRVEITNDSETIVVPYINLKEGFVEPEIPPTAHSFKEGDKLDILDADGNIQEQGVIVKIDEANDQIIIKLNSDNSTKNVSLTHVENNWDVLFKIGSDPIIKTEEDPELDELDSESSKEDLIDLDKKAQELDSDNNLDKNKEPSLNIKPVKRTDSNGNTIEELLFNLFFYTHNTFEVGLVLDQNQKVQVDDKGNIIEDGNWTKERIDSLNGLIKLQSLKGASPETLISILGELRSAIFSESDKMKLITRIEKILNMRGSGLEIRFGLKAFPVINDSTKNSDKNYVQDKPTAYTGQNKNERIIHNHSNGSRSKEVQPHKIVMMVKQKNSEGKLKDILMIPVATMSSPITIAQLTDSNGNPLFPQLNTIMNNNSISIHERVQQAIIECNKHPEWGYIRDLFIIYQQQNDWYKEFDQDWLPARNLKNLGNLFTKNKGLRYLSEGYQFNSRAEFDENTKEYNLNDWTTLSDFANDPSIRVSSILKLTDKNGLIINGTRFNTIKPGRSFILISNDTDINTDEKMINQYLKQLKDPLEPEKVRRFYVMNPVIGLEDYLNFLENYTFAPKETKSIMPKLGQPTAYYSLLKLIISDQMLLDKIKELSFGEDLLQHMQQIEDGLKQGKSLKTMLSEDIPFLVKEDSNGNKIPVKFTKRSYYLRKALLSLVYGKSDQHNTITPQSERKFKQDIIKRIQEVMNNANYLLTTGYALDSQINVKPFVIIKQDYKDGKPAYTLNGLPFMINAKIDSVTFQDQGEFREEIRKIAQSIENYNSEIKQLENKNLSDKAYKTEFAKIRRNYFTHIITLTEKVEHVNTETKIEKEYKNLYKTVREKLIRLGLIEQEINNLLNEKEVLSSSEANDTLLISKESSKIVEKLRKIGVFAIKVGDDIKVSNHNSFKNWIDIKVYDKTEYDNNSNTANNLTEIKPDNYGNSKFYIIFTDSNFNEKIKEASYENGILSFNDDSTNSQQQYNFNITEREFSEFLTNLKGSINLLDTRTEKSSVRLQNFFNKQYNSIKEFIDQLKSEGKFKYFDDWFSSILSDDTINPQIKDALVKFKELNDQMEVIDPHNQKPQKLGECNIINISLQ